MRFLLVLTLTLSFFLCASAQRNDDLQWKTITSKNGDLSVSLPGDFLVYWFENEANLYWGNSEVSYAVRMESMPYAKRRLRPRQYVSDPQPDGSQSTVGDFDVMTYTLEKGRFGTIVDMASSKGYYSVTVLSKTANNPTANQILNSILLNGTALIKQGSQTHSAETQSIKISSLKTSQPIKDALNHKQSGKIEVKYYGDVFNNKDIGLIDRDVMYSSPLIILKKVAPKFNYSLRVSRAQGMIRLSILFKADGDIGEINVLNSGPSELVDASMEAVKKMKFFPARINGAPADSYRVIEYNFWIY